MKSNKLFILLLLLATISGCGGGGGGGSTTTTKTLVSIAVTPANSNIAVGTNQQFIATGTYSDSTTQDLTTSVTWTSSNTGVATIVADGLATATAAGSTTITAASGGVSGATSLTVSTLVSIAVTPANPSIAMGTTQQFTATGTFSNSSNQNITTSATWSSTAPSVATVSNTGIATPVAAGTTTITAMSGSISASTTLTVTAATLVSIAVTPANPSVTLGTTQQFTATGTFSNSSNQNLTASVTWSSTAPSVATVSNTGIANPVAAGTTTIMASSGSISGTTSLTVAAPSSPGANVVPITVTGSLRSSPTFPYPNKPLVSVTICSPGTSTCQTINDILLDTGSYGLRILSQALTVPLTQVASGSGQLAECVQFGDDSSEWGPVEMASVILGNEPAVQIPILVVNQSFGSPPSGCSSPNSTPDTSPDEAGFNGILGVGLFAQDCGNLCATSTNNGGNPIYYSCIGTTCTATMVPNANQVINPVAALPAGGDNNGVLVQIQSVPLGGVPSVNGNLILGIGTQTNNQPMTVNGSQVTEYPADSTYGDFNTSFDGQNFPDNGFIDSGSNALFFGSPRSLIPQCPSSSSGSGYFCETPTTQFTATNFGYSGSSSGIVSFYIGYASTLINTSYNVFSELGGYTPGEFDWGLPFFFGRNVFVGIEGTSSSLGSGPYWAY